jgi:hypothetical protein
MPSLSAWTIRAALTYLMAGFTLGSLLLAHKGVPYSPFLWRLLPAHIEFLVMGWIINLVFGVAYWILPRFPGSGRGNPILPAAGVVLLNVGILITAAYGTWGGSEWLLFLGRLCELVGVVLFALQAWRRVRPTVIRSSR